MSTEIRKIGSELTAGIFLLSAICLFAFSVWVLGRERQIFAEQKPYSTTFRDVKGLNVGAPVRLGGINIGRVSNVGFSPDLNDPLIHVDLLINESYLERLRDDSIVTIETQGLLGDRFLSISPGQDKKQLLPPSNIKSSEVGDVTEVLSKAGEIVDHTTNIAKDLREFMSQFREETAGHINESAKNLSDLTRAVKNGDGLLHHLVYGKSGSDTIDTLKVAAKNFSDLAAQLNELTSKIKDGKGVIHQLIYKESDGGLSQVISKLSETADNLSKASDALANGSGTLGALLVDPQLYDNLVEVTDGAKRSFILRQAIKSSLNQKEK